MAGISVSDVSVADVCHLCRYPRGNRLVDAGVDPVPWVGQQVLPVLPPVLTGGALSSNK